MPLQYLEQEMLYFKKIKPELLGTDKGKYALIHEETLVDTFSSKEDAIKRGYSLFGNAPFLVKKIEEFEDILNFTSNLIITSPIK